MNCADLLSKFNLKFEMVLSNLQSYVSKRILPMLTAFMSRINIAPLPHLQNLFVEKLLDLKINELDFVRKII